FSVAVCVPGGGAIFPARVSSLGARTLPGSGKAAHRTVLPALTVEVVMLTGRVVRTRGSATGICAARRRGDDLTDADEQVTPEAAPTAQDVAAGLADVAPGRAHVL